MKLILQPDKKLFCLFLLINAAGYDYENNQAGMHLVRIKFREKTKQLADNPPIGDLIKSIAELPLTSNEYIRLANLVILPQKHKQIFDDKKKSVQLYQQWKKILPKFNSFLNLSVMDELFKEYCTELKNISDYKIENFTKEFASLQEFFNLSEKISFVISIHLNLLESYLRGTNYFSEKNCYVSCSLNFENSVSWQTVRHEIMHLLLKKIFKQKSINKNVKIPVNKNYAADSNRVKFDENFIMAANLFFIPDQEKRLSNLKYYSDKGFEKINIFYKFIEENFVDNRNKLSAGLIRKLIKRLD